MWLRSLHVYFYSRTNIHNSEEIKFGRSKDIWNVSSIVMFL